MKTGDSSRAVGSNPTLSATLIFGQNCICHLHLQPCRSTQVAIRGSPAKGVVGLNRARVRIPPSAPKKKDIRKDVLLFFCSGRRKRPPPFGIEMLGIAKPSLRRGFACGKTLVRRTRAAGQKAGWVILLQRSCQSQISILTVPSTWSQSELCDHVFLCLQQKRRHPPAPLLLHSKGNRIAKIEKNILYS